MDDITSAVVMFVKRAEWAKLGMNQLREQGAAIMFHGAPGTGKTITARWLARKLKLTLQEMDFGQIGSEVPGQLARNIKKLFAQAAVPDTRNEPSMIFLDECDTMLVSRTKLGHNSMWMLEPINALLSAIGSYPGLVVLATNAKPAFLDYALERRLIGSFLFDTPSYVTRCQLWRKKWPKKLPVQPQEGDIERLAAYPRTGAEVENLLIRWVSDTLRRESPWTIDDLHKLIQRQHNDNANKTTTTNNDENENINAIDYFSTPVI
jgi:AAA+ superfamily predicted ATPase